MSFLKDFESRQTNRISVSYNENCVHERTITNSGKKSGFAVITEQNSLT